MNICSTIHMKRAKAERVSPLALWDLFVALALAVVGWGDSILFKSAFVLNLDICHSEFLFLYKLLTEGGSLLS